jgi:hypothetical protein
MHLRRPPLWRLVLPAIVFLALAVFALATEEALGYRTRVRAGPTGWRLIPKCATPFDYWANVVLCLQAAGVFAAGGLVRHPGLEAWLRNRPVLWAGLFLAGLSIMIAVAFGLAALLA